MACVAILEDEPFLLEELTGFLGEKGHRVTAVASVAAFREARAPGKLDIAVVDRGLPDGDGLDVVAEIRAAGGVLWIIIITGRGEIRREGLRPRPAGPDGPRGRLRLHGRVEREVDRKGFRVLAGIRTGVDAQRLRSRSSSRLTSIVIDVTSETSIGNAFSIVKARVGESGLAGLDNNAGSGIASPVECVRLPERLPAAGAGGMANQGLPVRAGLHLHAGRRGGGRPRGPDGEEAEGRPAIAWGPRWESSRRSPGGFVRNRWPRSRGPNRPGGQGVMEDHDGAQRDRDGQL